MSETVVAQVACSMGRRLSSVVIVAGLGVTLLWLAVAEAPGGVFWRAILALMGVAALLFAGRVYRATDAVLLLTPEDLRDDRGRVLARVDEMAGVERGMFAFKPSNGFVLRLKSSAAPAWQPGLWWRWGNRLAVGGVPSGHMARAMADAIQITLDDRH
ncbi:hypothetical protein M8756_03090 [Lutimaribacter sp. EGI FJ00015]|uniref:Uncharacterized protein n=1 Tax=Lutimaribacter degradans TaxID=2945989 RepID=A0ACC5ZR42_9RHOB|nr:hypothetical protein [Lutimaribacter sp. EGI FJ00013]MCM2560771.1 hypothetical protein [Lutimaribacter sp. EGI FJ00013]MCO0612283.1 hypothetical protein [Lutimaribacter sp. EGI FJ00015]MCO0634596.1 hypothetical protein [Lutimaribacter sp. EGI FJ00014]